MIEVERFTLACARARVIAMGLLGLTIVWWALSILPEPRGAVLQDWSPPFREQAPT